MAIQSTELNAAPLLNAAQLAELLGISKASVYRRRSLGEPLPPAVIIGASIRWERHIVARWVAAQREANQSV